MYVERKKVFFSCLLGLIHTVFLTDTTPSYAEKEVIKAAVIRVDREALLPLSRLDIPPDDLGFAGGALATADNQTTGNFLGFSFQLTVENVTPDQALALLSELQSQGISYFVILGDREDLLALSEVAEPDTLLFNALAPDNDLRDKNCRANIFHIAPSRAMRSDALAQYLVWKGWKKWMLVHGSHDEDRRLGESYQRSAKKFGAEIVETRVFEDRGGRRTDSGHVLVQKQIPTFTQRAEDHDVIVTADESDLFAAYFPFRNWEARPVVGSAGLQPITWNGAHEAWGSTQMQRRFEALAGRRMREEDYQVWLALRVLGEAVSRTLSGEPAVNRDYILSSNFELAAFKGSKVTFRNWNGQLRQPILLSDGRLTVSVSPQEGFFHYRSPLDSLGLDEPDSACQAFSSGG